MTTATKTYTIREYNTGDALGEITLTDRQFAQYEESAQQPEGLIRLDDLPAKIDDLSIVMDGSTTVYLD